MLVHRALEVRGGKLSNTWPTCPVDRDNLGKLRIIPDSRTMLEMQVL